MVLNLNSQSKSHATNFTFTKFPFHTAAGTTRKEKNQLERRCRRALVHLPLSLLQLTGRLELEQKVPAPNQTLRRKNHRSCPQPKQHVRSQNTWQKFRDPQPNGEQIRHLLF